MPLEILTCHGDDAKRWDEIVASMPPVDIHFTSAYARVQETIDANPLLIIAADGDCQMIQPIDLRVIGAGPDLDVANLYGYGGPRLRGRVLKYMTLGDEIAEWMKSVGVVSEFCTRNPMIYLPGGGEPPNKYVALIDLRLHDEQIYTAMRRAHRRSIRKADETGVVVSRAETNPENMLLMSTLYRTSMSRLDAAGRWIFPTAYFDAHASELGDDGCSLYFAGVGHEVDRSLLVIHHGEIAYAHFLGSTGENTRIGIDEKLYFSAAMDLKVRGFKAFHLGGGATSSPNDSLFQFKAGFSAWTLPVYRSFRVFDQSRYAALCADKAAQEIAQHGRESIAAFLPKYRREWA